MKNIIQTIFFILILSDISIAKNSQVKKEIIIDWQKGYILSKGKAGITFNGKGTPVDALTGEELPLNGARIQAYKNAREAAILNMAEAIKSLRIDPYNRLLDVMKNNAYTQRIIADRFAASMTYKESPAGFDTSLCEAKLSFGSIIASLPYDFPSDDFPVRDDIPVSTPYSALIIDGRGLDIVPMLFPSVYSDTGLEIYGKNFIDSSFAARGGMASYCYDEDHAWTDRRAGEHPYFAVAVKSINNCPILSEKDVRRILSSQKTINNLKKCRVIFIIEKESRK